MREFGPAIDRRLYDAVTRAALELYEVAPKPREVTAAAFAMEGGDPDRVVVTEALVKLEDGRVRVAQTKPAERPPFEWLIEITSDIGETDYFKHYLVRENDIVLAQRKVLTPIDEAEAAIILADLTAARAALDEA
jgi:hypothetical protein